MAGTRQFLPDFSSRSQTIPFRRRLWRDLPCLALSGHTVRVRPAAGRLPWEHNPRHRAIEDGPSPDQRGPDERCGSAAAPSGAGPAAGDDAALIERSYHAPECFGVLFDRHAPEISRYVTRRLGPDAADDLVAETFLVAFRKRGHYDPACHDARPWLYGIATRLIGRHRRDEVRFFQSEEHTSELQS